MVKAKMETPNAKAKATPKASIKRKFVEAADSPSVSSSMKRAKALASGDLLKKLLTGGVAVASPEPVQPNSTPRTTGSSKKRRDRKKKKSTPNEEIPVKQVVEKKDPWKLIEESDVQPAKVVVKPSADLEEQKAPLQQWQIDRKKKHRCDGAFADKDRPLQNRRERVLEWKRRKEEEEGGSGQMESVQTTETAKENGPQKVEISKARATPKKEVAKNKNKKETITKTVQIEKKQNGKSATTDLLTVKTIKKGIKMAELFDEEEEESDQEDVVECVNIGDTDEEESDIEDGETDEETYFRNVREQDDGLSDSGDELDEDEDDEEVDEELDEEYEDEDEELSEGEVMDLTDDAERVIELNEGDGVEETDEEEDEEIDEEVDVDEEDELDDEDLEELEEEESEVSDDDENAIEFRSDVSEDSLQEAFLAHRETGKIEAQGKSPLANPVFAQFPFQDVDSAVTATKAFSWMVHPCDTQTFFNDYFQNNALVVKRNNKKHYGDLFDVKQFTKMLQDNYVEYGTNINIAEYKKGVRYTRNGSGRVYPGQIREFLEAGYSVQLVNPQSFSDNIWYLCEILQELFGCFVGANTYLTPAGSAGFAPHWDDIDAFLLQLEGRKYWKVYSPAVPEEELPLESSGNFTDADLKGRKPCFEGWLETGDMLYIPRGFIHQASTQKAHSFHVTISMGRKWSVSELIQSSLPMILDNLTANRLSLRRSLPVGMLDMLGVAQVEYKNEEQAADKIDTVLDREMRVIRRGMNEAVESAVDQMARQFLKQALPPKLTPEEQKLSVIGCRDVLLGKRVEFHAKTQIKFIRRHAQRLLFESEERCFITHRMSNSLVYEGRPEVSFDVPPQFVEGVCQLQSAYPEWTELSELGDSCGSAKETLQLAQLLYTHGLIMVKNK